MLENSTSGIKVRDYVVSDTYYTVSIIYNEDIYVIQIQALTVELIVAALQEEIELKEQKRKHIAELNNRISEYRKGLS